MLKTAIDLKRIIEDVPNKLKSIGTCYTLERQWKVEQGDEESDEYSSDELIKPEDEMQSEDDNDSLCDIKKLHFAIKWIDSEMRNIINIYTDGQFGKAILDKYVLKVNSGSEWSLKLSEITPDHLEKMYTSAAVATFGNLATMTTDINSTVRSARDITSDCFSISPEIYKKIATLWRSKFNWIGKLKVEPYKINLYKAGDVFKEHRDTPSKYLVGTFLLGLGDTSDGSLQVNDLNYEFHKRTWKKTSLGSWCGFYPDLIHNVTKLTKGIRANISFKIYASDIDESLTSATKLLLDNTDFPHKFLTDICHKQKKFGIILSHDYSLEAEHLKGTDRIYYDLFKYFGCNIKVLPALIKLTGRAYHDDNEYTCNSSVYVLTDKALEYVSNSDSCTTKPLDDHEIYHDIYHNGINHEITFYNEAKGYKWYKDSQCYYQYTGNECQPAEINSLYLHRVLIIN
jgi:hypothetical protein